MNKIQKHGERFDLFNIKWEWIKKDMTKKEDNDGITQVKEEMVEMRF